MQVFRDSQPEDLTAEQAVVLIDEKAAKGPAKGKPKRKAPAKKAPAARKKSAPKKAAKT